MFKTSKVSALEFLIKLVLKRHLLVKGIFLIVK